MSPQRLLSLHKYLTILWAILIVPSVIWWKNSVPWLVLISAYANFVGHFSSWEAARAEVYMDESDKV